MRHHHAVAPVVFASFGGAVCLHAEAYLGWSQLLLLPPCLDGAPAAALRALGVGGTVGADVSCRHLATVCRRWRASPPGWRDAQIGTAAQQAFSLLCCAHAAHALRGKLAVGSFEGAAELASTIGEAGAAKRALVDAPFIIADDGAMLPARHVCTELFADLGPTARACPAYLSSLCDFLTSVGGALTSASLAAEEIVVSATRPHESLFAKIELSCDALARVPSNPI